MCKIQSNSSIMCGYFYIGFIDFILTGKTLIDHAILFSPYNSEKNGTIILKYFKDEWEWFYWNNW